ncbi:hypothetical protein Pan97_16700 [Bremerella volcania]|uniref:Uncharacterized protein n=1 Tax=Bremerella volcania TaxID=2527984 RepID=A0A518C604_9BACT|nr:hypothetical protein [Bremerella volcania]QDU74658.1 hypothetical protein Pan97_16700 [Bremerella volcania]
MFSQRELATMLAALRCWQHQMAGDRSMPSPFASHFDEAHPLTPAEIDALCEQLNTSVTSDDFVEMCHTVAESATHWAHCSDWREACAVFAELGLRCRQLLERAKLWKPEPCECEQPGYFQCGVPGILAHLEGGKLESGSAVERCDLCQRYPSDEAALVRLREMGIA